jgi:hypothetical protein
MRHSPLVHDTELDVARAELLELLLLLLLLTLLPLPIWHPVASAVAASRIVARIGDMTGVSRPGASGGSQVCGRIVAATRGSATHRR